MANITKVYLLNVPLENDYKNTLFFNNVSDQRAYFESRVIRSFSYNDFSYQRKDSIIRVPVEYDDIYMCNYVMYQNSAYSDKWFYAFVTDLEYINDGRTDLHIETDVIQTWYFDYNVKASFIEREHVDNDELGLHVLPEPVDTGDYVLYSETAEFTLSDYVIVVSSTMDLNEISYRFGGIFNGIPSGDRYYVFELNDLSGLSRALQTLNDRGGIEAVSALFIAPRWIVGDYQGGIVPNSLNTNKYRIELDRITSNLGYIPSNNKLLTHPFVYFMIDNGQSGAIELKQEVWNEIEGKLQLEVEGALTPGCSIRCYPLSYNGHPIAYIYGISLGKYPQINWATDPYINWLTENGLNLAFGLSDSVNQAVTGAVTNNVGSLTGGLRGIASVMHTNYLARRIPPQIVGNGNNGDVITASKNNRFHVYSYGIKFENAKRIDRFFNMFGYQVNDVKIPNSNHRERWWYTKCIDVNLNGDIPQRDIIKIKSIYNTGITFWRNASEIERYDLSNAII